MNSTNMKSFIYVGIFAMLAVVGLGYYVMPEKVTYQSTQEFEDPTQRDIVSDDVTPVINSNDHNQNSKNIKTYTNNDYGYSLRYGLGVTLSEIDTPPIKSACVVMETEGGKIFIDAGADVACGANEIASPKVAVSEVININNKTYNTSGFFSETAMTGFLTLDLNENITATMYVNTAPSKWVYDQIMFNLKDILSSIQLKSLGASISNIPTPIACTMDAMMCPDGSYVGRSGPSCEFACPPVSAPQERVMSYPHFSLQYDSSIFSEVPVVVSLPPKYIESYRGSALILASRVNQLGQEKCSYGESGMISTCSPEKEFGLSFGVVEKSVADLTAGLDNSLKQEETIAGKKTISWTTGVEGYNTIRHYVPLGLNKTLVITESYYYDSYSPMVKYPTPSQFDEIISTLKLSE